MNGLPYYKAYPRDFVEGTAGMRFELKGAYRLVLDLIYMQGGKLPDDARYISGLLGCSVKKWNGLRIELLELGKISAIENSLTNLRAITELEILAKYQDKQAENASRPRKNKDLQQPNASHTEPDTDTEPNKKEEEKSLAPQAASKAKNGSRLSTDWVLPKAWGEWALGNVTGATVEIIRSQADQFRDYWVSKAGAGARKTDWEATWRNWMRNAKFNSRASPAQTGKPRNMFEASTELLNELKAAENGTRPNSNDLRLEQDVRYLAPPNR